MSCRKMLPLLLAAVLLSVAGPALAQIPNLTYFSNSDLTYPLTPTTTNPPGTALLPATLPGNMDTIYLSKGLISTGPGDVLIPINGTHRLDGEILDWWSLGPMQGYSWILEYGFGPYNVRGGRHTLGYAIDELDEITETSEIDNVWGHQFVFTPYVLSPGTPKDRGTPPIYAGGSGSIVDGSPIYGNCDGFRFASTGWWNAIILHAAAYGDDYDLEIFNPSTGSEDGFIGCLAFSAGIHGYLDAIFVNRNTVGIKDYDIGVTNVWGGTGHFVVEQVVSEPAWVGINTTVSFGPEEYLKIWDTYVEDPGWITVAVDDSVNTAGNFRVGWIDEDATIVGMYDVTGWVTYGDQGEIRLSRYITTPGYYGLVLHRHQSAGGQAVVQKLVIEPTPPDPRPWDMPGWHSSLVPTPVPITTGMFPSLPDTLHGYAPETYFSFGVKNDSNAGSPPVDVAVYRDGVIDHQVAYLTQPLGPLDIIGIHDSSAQEIPGGRHTLTVEVDYPQALHEIIESNNKFGEQYCWSPLEISPGVQYRQPSPGPATGGWETVGVGHVLDYNCDGYRIYTGYHGWEGVVLTQASGSDHDLTVHHPLEGVKNGFDDLLSRSNIWGGHLDFVLFNNNLLPAMAHDIGVENWQGNDPYTIEAVGSTNLPIPPTGTHGPFTMPVSNMLQIHNIYLEADMYAFRLDNLAGAPNWAISLHPHNVSRPVRQQTVPGGYSSQSLPGDPEWFTVVVPAAGFYGLAVYKDEPADLDVEGTYELTIMRGVSDVQDKPDLPAVTLLTGVHPNPFNPQTEISYELATPADVGLAIYDVKGALVKRLVNEGMSAGRHSVVWYGRDEGGSRAASGVYLVRFMAGNHREVQKVVMVK